MSGPVNIPYGASLQREGNLLFLNGRPITTACSQNGIEHFCRDDDNRGAERGWLIRVILKSQPFRSTEQAIIRRDFAHLIMPYEDTLLFDMPFYEAETAELRRLARALRLNVKER